MDPQLDFVIPVYNEGSNILATLGAIAREVKTPARVLICYDIDEDNTLPAVRNSPEVYAGLDVAFVRNTVRGAHLPQARRQLSWLTQPMTISTRASLIEW